MEYRSASALFALTVSTIFAAGSALAQQQQLLNFGSNYTAHVGKEGTVVTPASSVPRPATGAVEMHTNVHVFQRDGMPATSAVRPLSGPPVAGYFFETPASIACIYNLVTPTQGCNPNNVLQVATGGSRVVAIVDAYHAPNAMADLTSFSRQFGLPLPTSSTFQVVFAASNGTQTTRAPAYDPGWEVEQSLDIEWVHAMAPNAKIILVEAASSSLSDLLGAELLAGKLVSAAGGGQVSNSWGASEFSQEAQYDSYFAAGGVVYFASSGDTPGAEWPSVSANVVAVGGTSISRHPTTGAFMGEAAWDSSGGGPSAYVPRPAFQNAVSAAIGGTARGVPDLAAVANPATGVWVYDGNAGGWIVVGGTSVAAPVAAGITNSAGRFSASSGVELSRIYANPSLFFDVQRGICGPYAGYWAAQGWDFCTGNGSPSSNNVL